MFHSYGLQGWKFQAVLKKALVKSNLDPVIFCCDFPQKIHGTWESVTRENLGIYRMWFTQDDVSIGVSVCQAKNKKEQFNNLGIFWVVPPPSNSHHQDYYIFSRGSL